jgi:hypothetical protein
MLLAVANFYEKALFVKVDVATDRSVADATALPSARYASIRTFGELTLLWLGALWDPSFRAAKEVLPSSERPSRRVGQVRMAQSPHIRSEALSRVGAVAIRRFRVLATLPVVFTSSSLVCSIASLWLSCLPLPLAPMGVVERIVDLRAHPQLMQEHG